MGKGSSACGHAELRNRYESEARHHRNNGGLSVCAVVVSLCVVSSAQERPRLFPPQDLGLIETPDREEWQKPDLIMDKLKIADGSSVGEVGAGGGWFTIRLARRVGPNGVVHAEDIQPPMVELMGRHVARENLPWVKPLLGTPTDPRLPPKLDVVLIAFGYREMDEPARPGDIVTLFANAARSLAPHGCFGVVDFLPGSGGPGPEPGQRVAPEEVIATASAAGLTFLARETIPPFVYLLVFGKETSRCASSP
jgi:SAM-dependent methyltransferase